MSNAVTRFVLSGIRQHLFGKETIKNLERTLYQLIGEKETHGSHEAEAIQGQLEIVQQQVGLARRNLAFAKSDAEHDAIAAVFNEVTQEKARLEMQLAVALQGAAKQETPRERVAKILSRLSQVEQLLEGP